MRLTDEYARAIFGRTQDEAREAAICVRCGDPVNKERLNEFDRREYNLSALCFDCFDDITADDGDALVPIGGELGAKRSVGHADSGVQSAESGAPEVVDKASRRAAALKKVALLLAVLFAVWVAYEYGVYKTRATMTPIFKELRVWNA